MEPTLENHSLEVLLGILQRRIELDKEVLFQFTQLKKEIKLLTAKNSSNSSSSSTGVGSSKSDPSVAPLLMRFQRGCQQVSTVLYIIHNIGSVELYCPQFWREIEKKPRQIAAGVNQNLLWHHYLCGFKGDFNTKVNVRLNNVSTIEKNLEPSCQLAHIAIFLWQKTEISGNIGMKIELAT